MATDLVRLATLIAPLRPEAERDDPAWRGSPFDWVRRLPSPKRRGAIGEKLLTAILHEAGIPVEATDSIESDRCVGGLRTEIKTAFRSRSGRYTFMQIRPAHDFERLLLFGISPDRLDLYDLAKSEMLPHARRQHIGAHGSGETRLFFMPADAPPAWLAPFGGELEVALGLMRARLAATS